MNPIAYIFREIQKYVLKNVDDVDEQTGLALIRVHNNKLAETGDLSFSGKALAWEKKFNAGFQRKIPNNDEDLHKFLSDFLSKAKSWEFPVMRLEYQSTRFCLFFDRDIVMSKVLQMVLRKESNGSRMYGHLMKKPHRRITKLKMTGDENNLSYHRANLIGKVLDRVLEYSEWNVVKDSANENVLQVKVQSVAARTTADVEMPTNVVTILCGIVINPSGKLSNIETSDYIKLRTNDLNLMAIHKYGIRPKDDEVFSDLMSRLGKAAVTVDLLEKKCSSPAPIIRNGLGSNTKGACFILYNSARLETLLKTFEIRVKDGAYGTLPPVKEIDFSLLNNEEEWQLVFVYIFGFPDLIERCLRQLESGIFASHLIVQFLSGFVALFSVYYRRIRILTEYRPHLMPQLYARIYLLKALREVFNETLSLLDIEPVSHM